MGNPLFAKKSLDRLIEEAKESGEHSLKKTLGPFQLTALAFSCFQAWARTMPVQA